jgi:hypothetical protein
MFVIVLHENPFHNNYLNGDSDKKAKKAFDQSFWNARLLDGFAFKISNTE